MASIKNAGILKKNGLQQNVMKIFHYTLFIRAHFKYLYDRIICG